MSTAFDYKNGTAIQTVSYIIFGLSMLLLFVMSTLLHSMPRRLKRFFSILDHSAIYILIAGTYTPFLLVTIKGALGWSLFTFSHKQDMKTASHFLIATHQK